MSHCRYCKLKKIYIKTKQTIQKKTTKKQKQKQITTTNNQAQKEIHIMNIEPDFQNVIIVTHLNALEVSCMKV